MSTQECTHVSERILAFDRSELNEFQPGLPPERTRTAQHSPFFGQ
jgi:hypothetical protein